MFTDGRLNGSILPNVFLDFFSGSVKTNKLAETYAKMPINAIKYSINIDKSHNVSIPSYTEPRLLFMPYPTEIKNLNGDAIEDTIIQWQPDGICSTLTAQVNYNYQKAYKKPNSKNVTLTNVCSYAIVVCADGRISDHRSYRYYPNADYGTEVIRFEPLGQIESAKYSKYDGNGYFVINGELVKFLVIEPSSIVKLRSCDTLIDGVERTFWYVENADDFSPISFRFEVYTQKYLSNNNEIAEVGKKETVYFVCPLSTTGATYERAYGSKFYKSLQGEDVNVADTKTIAIGFDMDEGSVELITQ
jgi:hypothetical protein